MQETGANHPQSRLLRRDLLFSLAVIVPLGFGTKFYTGPGAVWVSGSAGGLLYEIFWCLFVLLLAPRARPGGIALGVFLATCALEFLQLWRTPLLEPVRATFLGRALIGDTFAWSDFPWYVAGCALGWWWMERLNR